MVNEKITFSFDILASSFKGREMMAVPSFRHVFFFSFHVKKNTTKMADGNESGGKAGKVHNL